MNKILLNKAIRLGKLSLLHLIYTCCRGMKYLDIWKTCLAKTSYSRVEKLLWKGGCGQSPLGLGYFLLLKQLDMWASGSNFRSPKFAPTWERVSGVQKMPLKLWLNKSIFILPPPLHQVHLCLHYFLNIVQHWAMTGFLSLQEVKGLSSNLFCKTAMTTLHTFLGRYCWELWAPQDVVHYTGVY